METQTLCICNKCGKTIEPLKGFIVHGNIYVIEADVESRGGLVGNAFPEASEDGTIMSNDIKEYAYHYQCLNQILMDPMQRPVTTVRSNVNKDPLS